MRTLLEVEVEVERERDASWIQLCTRVEGCSAPRAMASDYAPARVGSRAHVGCREEAEPQPPHFVSLTSYSAKAHAFDRLTRPGVVVLLL